MLNEDRNLLIFVEGLDYALDLTGVHDQGVKLTSPSQLVYEAHDYPW